MDELTKVALLGTSRYAGPIPTGDHPAASLVAGGTPADREDSLLLACGAQAVYALAGRLPESGIDPAVPAVEETKKAASRALAALLESALGEQANTLLLEFLKLMETRGVVLPPDLLPRLLETRDVELRQRLMPVLGERGAWLCRQNPDWAHFVKVAADCPDADPKELKRIWDEGTIEERCQTIETLRQLDAPLAREWVEEALPKEKHGNRMKLLKTLRTGLDPGDEPFFERCLDDRSPAVGQTAASLLCHLPDSALVQRMRNRAAGLFTIEKKGPAHKESKLVCTPPSELAPDWERDGFKKKAAEGEGLRASWAEHLVASVPPSFWVKQLGLEPPELMAAVADDPFAESVISGWRIATFRFDQPSPGWLAALWQYYSESLARVENRSTVPRRDTAIVQMEAILHAMAPAAAEAALAKALEPAPPWRDAEALTLLARWPWPWSVRFGTWFLAKARSHLERHTNEVAHRWALALNTNACAIPEELLSLALAPWKTPDITETASWLSTVIPREIVKFTNLIEIRQRFLQELDAQGPLPLEP